MALKKDTPEVDVRHVFFAVHPNLFITVIFYVVNHILMSIFMYVSSQNML
jgi:hypothetical protein